MERITIVQKLNVAQSEYEQVSTTILKAKNQMQQLKMQSWGLQGVIQTLQTLLTEFDNALETPKEK